MAEDFALRFRGAGEDPEPVGTIGLYERAGFVPFDTLRKAIRVGGRCHAKVHMALYL